MFSLTPHRRMCFCALLVLACLPAFSAQSPPAAAETPPPPPPPPPPPAEVVVEPPAPNDADQPHEMRAIPIEHAKAEEIVDLLWKSIRNPYSRRTVANVVFSADKRTNTVLITARPSAMARWTKAVKDLDVVTPQGRDAAQSDTTRLEFTAVCIQGSHKQLLAIDTAAIEAKAETAESFVESLQGFGDVQTLATASQLFDLSEGAEISRRVQVPYVRNRSDNQGSTLSPSIEYKDIKTKIEIKGEWFVSRTGQGRHTIEVSLDFLADSDVSVTETDKALTFDNLWFKSHSGMTSGKPIVISTSNSLDTGDFASVIVCRLVFTQMQPE